MDSLGFQHRPFAIHDLLLVVGQKEINDPRLVVDQAGSAAVALRLRVASPDMLLDLPVLVYMNDFVLPILAADCTLRQSLHNFRIGDMHYHTSEVN